MSHCSRPDPQRPSAMVISCHRNNMSKLFSHFKTLRKFHLELWLIWLRTTLRPCPNLGSSWLFSNLALHWSCLLAYIHFEILKHFIHVFKFFTRHANLIRAAWKVPFGWAAYLWYQHGNAEASGLSCHEMISIERRRMKKAWSRMLHKGRRVRCSCTHHPPRRCTYDDVQYSGVMYSIRTHKCLTYINHYHYPIINHYHMVNQYINHILMGSYINHYYQY